MVSIKDIYDYAVSVSDVSKSIKQRCDIKEKERY